MIDAAKWSWRRSGVNLAVRDRDLPPSCCFLAADEPLEVFEHGLHEEGLVEGCLKSLRDVQLKPYGLEAVPGIVSEDATTALRRLDFELIENETAPEVWKVGIKLWGFDGAPRTIYSIDELRILFEDKEVSWLSEFTASHRASRDRTSPDCASCDHVSHDHASYDSHRDSPATSMSTHGCLS